MPSRGTYLVIVLAVLAGAFVAVQSGLVWEVVGPGEYERATVSVVEENGTTLATVEVRIADTAAKRYTGLSDTDALPSGEGMLFVHDGVANRTYVMREMSFPLDIVFVDADGTITTIHHAATPSNTSDGDLRQYSGRAKWVLEVPRGWANETGVEVGDSVRIHASIG
jgi:uncharacterized membrane protein (UPF0127 family)